ncbi:Transcriptional regulator, LysR family [Bathymodiolus thermophilus thioautotrophic gill symbiont]|uniref:Transcriptional regulator, LysR family n=2 Tax=Bathymodiolus thermophilus thioautotrophic gill symbiont TaxID=2360 RepID=A0A8H8XFQ4_9GAMM|nr:Transcriptional regulator, LysR family [Bathymodiolus thermophilus thioautotrophic gill symbiont]
MQMNKKLPPLNNLNTFSVAAKHLSFSKAAEELSITQAAVSQQIRLLEQRLGFDLFHRLHRQLKLTEQGIALQNPVNVALNGISNALEKLNKNSKKSILTISILPSLAIKWLIPRLSDFNQKHPDIDIHINAHLGLSDFKHDDLSISFGHQHHANLVAKFLMDEDMFLVVSPKLLTGKYNFNKPNDLQHHTLIHDSVDCVFEAYGIFIEPSWDDFSKLLKVDIKNNKSLTLSQSHLVLQAAIAGQGVAIARSILVSDDLEAGQLVKIYKNKVLKSPGYHLVYPKSHGSNKNIQKFEQWILSACH